MIITADISKYLSKSVLCWLATASADGVPNVSPKEIFKHYDGDEVIIANIASPQSVRNIQANPQVCLSFIDILVQKGYQLKGRANILKDGDDGYRERKEELEQMTKGLFPFSSIICFHVESSKPILAPSYLLYPETTEEEQIENAKQQYGLG